MHYSRVLRRGSATTIVKRYSSEEDEYIRATAGKVPARQVAKTLGRSEPAVHQRRRKLGLSVGSISFDPSVIAARPLVAKTCSVCGKLKDSTEYRRQGNMWLARCIHCDAERVKRGELTPDQKRSSLNRANASTAKLQAESLESATRRGEPLTNHDFAIFQNPNLTLAEKARATQRTFKSARNVCSINGFTSKGSPLRKRSFPKWGIENPNT